MNFNEPAKKTDSAADLSGFVCRRCGECCRIKDGIVRITNDDVTAISSHIGISGDEFIAEWCDIAPDRKGLVLKNAEDGHTCIMLDEANRCRIYPVRPLKCRTFPYDWVNENSADYCPGLRTTGRPFSGLMSD